MPKADVEHSPTGVSRLVYSSGETAKGGPPSLAGSTGNIMVTSSPPGEMSRAHVTAHCCRCSGCSAHRNLCRNMTGLMVELGRSEAKCEPRPNHRRQPTADSPENPALCC